jgi:hypothetical protein
MISRRDKSGEQNSLLGLSILLLDEKRNAPISTREWDVLHRRHLRINAMTFTNPGLEGGRGEISGGLFPMLEITQLLNKVEAPAVAAKQGDLRAFSPAQ